MAHSTPIIVHLVNEDIFNLDAAILVNPVNTMGVMGKGLALEFKKRFPDLNVAYELYCQGNYLEVGSNMYYYDSSEVTICCMPTKVHWKDPSKLEYIRSGMNCLVNYLNTLISPRKVAIPKIGCGLGGLDWTNEVKPIVLEKLREVRSPMMIYLWE